MGGLLPDPFRMSFKITALLVRYFIRAIKGLYKWKLRHLTALMRPGRR
jgi:hypothetical protein